MDPFRNRPDLVSLWELSLRLHDLDPDIQSDEDLSKEIKETLRELVLSCNSYLRTYNDDYEQHVDTWISIPFTTIIIENKVSKQLTNISRTREYRKEFLDKVFISKHDFEKWAMNHDRRLPDFWFDPQEVELHNQALEERWSEVPVEYRASKPSEENQGAPKSERHVIAAKARHEPKKEIYREFYRLYKSQVSIQKTLAAGGVNNFV